MTTRVEARSSCHKHPCHPVSRTTLFEVHRRMTSGMGAPQVGHEATNGAGASRCGVVKPIGCRFTISRRMVSGGMAQRVCITPKWRTCMKPSGRTGWRKRRRNAMASRWAGRCLALRGLRYVKGTVRSLRETMRLLEMATLQTEGARDVKEVSRLEWPGWAHSRRWSRPAGRSVREAWLWASAPCRRRGRWATGL